MIRSLTGSKWIANSLFTSKSPSITRRAMSPYLDTLAVGGVIIVSTAVPITPPPNRYFPPNLLESQPIRENVQRKCKTTHKTRKSQIMSAYSWNVYNYRQPIFMDICRVQNKLFPNVFALGVIVVLTVLLY